ncbi:hypothetical protein ACOI1C_19540 [Bacillus sp. DJP31]|uniref:hypothetical protein n=1 Tax=Bacillus sp. DJP31 TaxID=3409789 RepID=UPI003BB7D700
MKNNSIEYKEVELMGYGVFSLVKRDGSRKQYLLNSIPTDEDIEKYKLKYSKDDVDLVASYLVIHHYGKFTIVFGSPTKNFHLPFEEYKEEMFKNYGDDFEFSDVLVPIEE